MVIRRNSENGRVAATLLATSLVILSGASASAFIVLTAAERATWRDWVVWAGIFGGVLGFLVWMRRPTDEPIGPWWQFWRRSRPPVDAAASYEPQYRTPARRTAPTPPSLEKVRELSEQSAAVLWVPRGSTPPREEAPPRRPQ